MKSWRVRKIRAETRLCRILHTVKGYKQPASLKNKASSEILGSVVPKTSAIFFHRCRKYFHWTAINIVLQHIWMGSKNLQGFTLFLLWSWLMEQEGGLEDLNHLDSITCYWERGGREGRKEGEKSVSYSLSITIQTKSSTYAGRWGGRFQNEN